MENRVSKSPGRLDVRRQSLCAGTLRDPGGGVVAFEGNCRWRVVPLARVRLWRDLGDDRRRHGANQNRQSQDQHLKDRGQHDRRGELTEGSFTNLFIERDGRLLTPPVSCGLLDGTLRRELIEDPGTPVEERVLGPEDLESADRVLLGNSVRGLVPGRPRPIPTMSLGDSVGPDNLDRRLCEKDP